MGFILSPKHSTFYSHHSLYAFRSVLSSLLCFSLCQVKWLSCNWSILFFLKSPFWGSLLARLWAMVMTDTWLIKLQLNCPVEATLPLWMFCWYRKSNCTEVRLQAPPVPLALTSALSRVVVYQHGWLEQAIRMLTVVLLPQYFERHSAAEDAGRG